MNKDVVRLVVSFQVNDFDKFSSVSDACTEYVLGSEPGTLVYDWYVDADRINGRLIEVYESQDAFKQHLLGPVFKKIAPGFGESITWLSIESFGPLPNEFHKILGGLASTNWPQPISGL